MNISLWIGCLEAFWGLLRPLAAPAANPRLTAVTLIVFSQQVRLLGQPFQLGKKGAE
jgi:hypothetical protein